MDIGQVVTYEAIYELVVKIPNTEQPIGLTMGIRSASSEKSKAIVRKHMNEHATNFRTKQKKITAEQLEANELELTAACIAWWKWGNDYKGEPLTYQGGQPELSMKVAIQLLNEVNWIYAQVKEASNEVENFMPREVKDSVSSSVNLSSMIQEKINTEGQEEKGI